METEEKTGLTVEEIGLLREIARWRRTHGVDYFQWRRGVAFGQFTEWKAWEAGPNGRQVRRRVAYDPAPTGIVSTDKDYYGGETVDLPPSTVVETVDMLVALGFLPAPFSSAYRAGWHASAVWHNCEGAEPEFERLFHDPANISFPVGEWE
jgi:hypothetical protein